MPDTSSNRPITERRETPRPAWLSRHIGFVQKHGITRSIVAGTAIAVVSSTVFCHFLYIIFEVPLVSISVIMPTLAPLVVAPPMLFILIRAIDLLGRAESGLHAQRDRLEAAVATAKNEAKKADAAAQAKSMFLAHMSHELRTPLNAILGFSETIRDVRLGPIGTESYREYAGHIHESGEHLLSLINDILDMSRIEAGRMELAYQACPLDELIRECVALIEAEAGKKNIELDLGTLPPDCTVWADRRAIKQVLINILSNAVKFTPDEGRVSVHATQHPRTGTEIAVSDSGIGIAAEGLEKIFEPFARLEHEESGTGLGLPLARGLVELHAGEMTVESEPGHGTCVTVRIPPGPT